MRRTCPEKKTNSSYHNKKDKYLFIAKLRSGFSVLSGHSNQCPFYITGILSPLWCKKPTQHVSHVQYILKSMLYQPKLDACAKCALFCGSNSALYEITTKEDDISRVRKLCSATFPQPVTFFWNLPASDIRARSFKECITPQLSNSVTSNVNIVTWKTVQAFCE